MPNVMIEVAESQTLIDEEVRELFDGVTSALSDALGIEPETIVVRVAQSDCRSWAVGGQPVVGTSNRAAQIGICVAKGSATPKQLKTAMAATSNVLAAVFEGWVHDASTITIQEVDEHLGGSIRELAADSPSIKAVA